MSSQTPTYTLITGASEGLGAEFARLAARDGRNMILTARQENKLHALAHELAADDLDILVIPADLSDPEATDALWRKATEGRHIDVLVNNAGLGAHGAFAESDWDRELLSLDVNLIALSYLMKQAIPHMQAHGGGRVLNVASIAGFMPGPNMAVYHATKAYVLSLSQAVGEELRGTNVSVTALCPGVTKTNFHKDGDMLDVRALKLPQMKAFDVAEEGWLEARIAKRVVVPGLMNKLTVLLGWLLPQPLLLRMVNQVMSKK